MNPKALFFDVDGTLMYLERHIPESTLESLKRTRELGNYVYVNSGRPIGTLTEVRERLDGLVDGWLCGCGTELIDGEETFLYYEMTAETEQKIRDLQDDCEIAIFLEGRNGWLNIAGESFCRRHEGMRDFLRRMSEFNTFADDVFQDRFFQASKFCAKSDEKTDLDRFMRLADEYGFYVIDRNGKFYECVPKGYSKGIAVEKMLAHKKIAKEDSYGFGDSTNDIEMFRACGTSIAMADHDPDLEKYADYITTALREDGIKNAMTHFGLLG